MTEMAISPLRRRILRNADQRRGTGTGLGRFLVEIRRSGGGRACRLFAGIGTSFRSATPSDRLSVRPAAVSIADRTNFRSLARGRTALRRHMDDRNRVHAKGPLMRATARIRPSQPSAGTRS